MSGDDGLQFTSITNTLEPELAKTFVYLWDIGPRKPVQPKRPDTPKGKPGDPEHDLGMVEFKEELEGYEAALKAYGKAKIEYAKWQQDQGGAIELRMYSCDAHDSLERDPNRYYISSSTRGHSNAPNHGLPAGIKPGHGHLENIRRKQQGELDLLTARRADPVFGQTELRP